MQDPGQRSLRVHSRYEADEHNADVSMADDIDEKHKGTRVLCLCQLFARFSTITRSRLGL
jgi:hypothetical protein